MIKWIKSLFCKTEIEKELPKYKFSLRSLGNLATCDTKLQEVFHEVIKEVDIVVICGHRGKSEQNSAFNKGASQLKFPNSKHNKSPSQAVDVIPYPVDWNDIARFKELAIVVKKVASKKEIAINWGGDWKSFKDYPHWEL